MSEARSCRSSICPTPPFLPITVSNPASVQPSRALPHLPSNFHLPRLSIPLPLGRAGLEPRAEGDDGRLIGGMMGDDDVGS